MSGPTEIKKEIQLLVEGNDQQNFFRAFVAHLSREDVQVQNFGGVNELAGFLLAFVNMSGFRTVESIGVVRDAENSATGAFQSVCSSLTNAVLSAPAVAGRPSDGRPPVRVLILPGGQQQGMLETLLCGTFVDEESKCIDRYFECVRSLPDVSLVQADKARVHAWLATRPEPHVSVGVAAKKGYWNLDHPALGGVREFLAAL